MINTDSLTTVPTTLYSKAWGGGNGLEKEAICPRNALQQTQLIIGNKTIITYVS